MRIVSTKESQMRYVFLAILVFSVTVGLITWSTRPDLLEAEFNQSISPIKNYFAAKRAAKWQAAKEQAWKQWSAQKHLPADCARPATSLRSLECRNELQLQANSFESEWENKIANGWQPESVN
jgi:hypothetical protein